MKFLFFLIIFSKAIAQDERFLKSLNNNAISQEKNRTDQEVIKQDYSYSVNSPIYRLDLNEDGVKEQLVFQKKDARDNFFIYDSQDKRVLTVEFESLGRESSLKKILVKKLGDKLKVLILFYYEGFSKGYEFQATGRLYFVTIENNDLTTLKSFKAIPFFLEELSYSDLYVLREYKTEAKDLNADGVKELIISNNKAHHIFKYIDHGVWKEL